MKRSLYITAAFITTLLMMGCDGKLRSHGRWWLEQYDEFRLRIRIRGNIYGDIDYYCYWRCCLFYYSKHESENLRWTATNRKNLWIS